jgi:hypothetical protein
VIGPTGLGSGTGFTQLDAPLLLGSSEANGGMSLVWYENPTGPGNVVQVGLNSSTPGSMTVTTGDLANTSYVWDFDNEGNLTLPTGGALTTTGNVSAGNVIINGQTLIATGAVNPDYINMTTSAAVNVAASGTDLTWDVNNGSSGIAYSAGKFSLSTGKTYHILAELALQEYSANGYLLVDLVDGTTNARIGSQTVTLPYNSGFNETNNPTLDVIHTPVANQDVKLRVTGGTVGLTAQLRGGGFTRMSIVQINPTVSLSAVSTITASGNISANNFIGNGSGLTSLPIPTVTQDITSNGAMSIMTYDGNLKYVSYATVEPSSGNIAGGNISASGNVTANNFTGNGNTLSNVATKTSGSWTLASGVNTVSISVPLNGTYAIWVNGNIPNGIVTYTATAVVTNTNVPVLGEQYGWFYEIGNALVLTSIPNQFVGTQGAISNASPYAGNTANVFTFGITNNSGNAAVVNYGYTKL